MSLLKLELLRLRRTWRGPGILAAFLLFGIMGPFVARYLPDIVQHLGQSGVQVIVPAPRPVDGITQYVANAQQLGLIGMMVLAIGALNIDAQPDIAIFFRTRVSVQRLVLVRYAVYATGASLAFVAGALAAWYESVVLVGHLPVGTMLAGIGYEVVFFVYAIAMAALASALSKSTVGAVLIALGLVLTPAALNAIEPVRGWVPLSLGTALIDVLDKGEVAGPLRAVGVALVVSAVSLWWAIRRLERREV